MSRVSGIGQLTMAFTLLLLLSEKSNRKRYYQAGPIIGCLSTISFALSSKLFPKNNTAYFIMAFASMISQGLGVGMNFTQGTPILMSFFPKITGRVCSWIHLASTVGFMCGPPIGSFIFRLAGYYVPFWTIASFQISTSLIIFFGVPYFKSVEDSNKKSFSLKAALPFVKHPGVICVLISGIVSFSSCFYFAVTFSPYLLAQFGISNAQSGNYAVVVYLGRVFGCLLFGFLVDKGLTSIIFTCIGCFSTSLGFLFVFLSQFSNFVNSIVVFEILFFWVIFTSAGAVVSFIHLIRKVYDPELTKPREVVDSNSAAMYSVCVSSAVGVGMSFYGGFLVEYLGFHLGSLCLSVSCFIVGSASTFYLVRSNLLLKKEAKTEDVEEKIEMKNEETEQNDQNGATKSENLNLNNGQAEYNC